MARAISRIFGVPWSSARTERARYTPTARASNAAATDSSRTAHSPPFSSNAW